MHLFSRPRRPRRSGEWTPDRAVTFIVTLAASRSVTLAAVAAGMSRKSAYALKARDPAFAAAWAAASKAGATISREGDKVDEVEAPRVPSSQGNSRKRAARSISSIARRRPAEAARHLFFARLAKCLQPMRAPEVSLSGDTFPHFFRFR